MWKSNAFFIISGFYSPIIRFLLGHQSLIDRSTCLWATLLLVQPPNWVPGISILDEFICHDWNGQFIYWCAVLISGWYFCALQKLHLSSSVIGFKFYRFWSQLGFSLNGAELSLKSVNSENLVNR